MDFKSVIPEIEKAIGYTFRDKALLVQAFTRTSYCNEQKSRTGMPLQSNEVLEFFGDSVLSTAIITLLMKDFAERYECGIKTELGEGDFSNIKSKLSDKRNLSHSMSAMGLQKFLLVGEGDKKLNIQDEPSVMEDLFESIIGAIYIDSGMDLRTVVVSVKRMLDVHKYLSAGESVIQSYKNALQEWCADKKHRTEPPIYKTLSESGPDHKKIYVRACYIGAKLYGKGEGKNQKIADSAAAEATLKMLREEYEVTAQVKDTQKNPMPKLREHARREKLPTPEFHDLGESITSTPVRKEYVVECRFAGVSTTGNGPDKKAAKYASAENMLQLISKFKNAENSNRKKAQQARKNEKSFSSKRKDISKQSTSRKKKNSAPPLKKHTAKINDFQAKSKALAAYKSTLQVPVFIAILSILNHYFSCIMSP